MSASRSDEVRERQAALLAKARTAYEDGSYDVARGLIEEILDLDPSTEEAAAAQRLLRRIQAELGEETAEPSRGGGTAASYGGTRAGWDRRGGAGGAGMGSAAGSAADDDRRGTLSVPRRGGGGGVFESSVDRGAPPAPAMPSPAREPAAGPPPAAPAVEELRRTPHMDISPQPPLAPRQRFTAMVYADTRAAQAGERAKDVVIKASATITSFELEVFLQPSAHFEVIGPDAQTLVIERDVPSSDQLPFKLRVVDHPAQAAGTPEIVAYFSYGGRPCGMVCREVEIEGVAAAPRPSAGATGEPALVPRRDGLAVEVDAGSADLQVDVVAGPARDGRTFKVRVRTPLLPGWREWQTEDWVLPGVTAELVADYMKEFTSGDIDNQDRLLELEGAGKELFLTAPEVFKRAFWELVDAGTPPETIAIVSEETYIPWELMVPTRRKDGRREERPPLGVEWSVARWSPRDHTSPPQRLPLGDSVVVAPRDSGLRAAEDEVQMVLGGFPGQRIDPASVEALDAWLAQRNTSLLHFACHGESVGEAESEGRREKRVRQVLKLEGGKVLNTTRLRALDGLCRALEQGRPLVFLNACQVGRPVPSLVGPGGFAEVFMELGAAAVVAPLWSVRDSIAHEIAVEFYRRVKAEPETPFAAILRDIRKKAYEAGGGEDTYAAYCFYGDPRATAAGT